MRYRPRTSKSSKIIAPIALGFCLTLAAFTGCDSPQLDPAARAQVEQELEQLRETNQELHRLRIENQELTRLLRDQEELKRLTGETEDLIRLRQENEQLRAQLEGLRQPATPRR